MTSKKLHLLKAFNAEFERIKEEPYAPTDIETFEKATRTYKFNCVGDVCVGDQVLFIEEHWSQYRPSAKVRRTLLGFFLTEATVVKDSYGKEKQQHTFTLQLSDGSSQLIKGRVIYRRGVWRKAWKDESQRQLSLNEKHARGNRARKARKERRMEDFYSDY